MAGIIVYPGIAPGSTEYFYNDMRVQQVMMLDKDDVHSVYKCTEMSDQKGTVECPFLLIIKNVNDEVNITSIWLTHQMAPTTNNTRTHIIYSTFV
jgi:hypothetical protein